MLKKRKFENTLNYTTKQLFCQEKSRCFKRNIRQKAADYGNCENYERLAPMRYPEGL
jgi:single-stranded DNA-binding protein